MRKLEKPATPANHTEYATPLNVISYRYHPSFDSYLTPDLRMDAPKDRHLIANTSMQSPLIVPRLVAIEPHLPSITARLYSLGLVMEPG